MDWSQQIPKHLYRYDLTFIVLGKTLQEGMMHIFLPFSEDVYLGVTALARD
jgi:hypothetical protein